MERDDFDHGLGTGRARYHFEEHNFEEHNFDFLMRDNTGSADAASRVGTRASSAQQYPIQINPFNVTVSPQPGHVQGQRGPSSYFGAASNVTASAADMARGETPFDEVHGAQIVNEALSTSSWVYLTSPGRDNSNGSDDRSSASLPHSVHSMHAFEAWQAPDASPTHLLTGMDPRITPGEVDSDGDSTTEQPRLHAGPGLGDGLPVGFGALPPGHLAQIVDSIHDLPGYFDQPPVFSFPATPNAIYGNGSYFDIQEGTAAGWPIDAVTLTQQQEYPSMSSEETCKATQQHSPLSRTSGSPPLTDKPKPLGGTLGLHRPVPKSNKSSSVAPSRNKTAGPSKHGFVVVPAPPDPSRNGKHRMEDMMSKFPTECKRRRYSPERRMQVAITRRIGVCFFCKLFKSRCDLGLDGVCNRCRPDPQNKLCFKLDFNDCCVFRQSSPIHNIEGRQDMKWAGTPGTITLEVSMTGTIPSKPLAVNCRLFEPEPLDRVDKFIGGPTTGETVRLPPYATPSFAEVTKALERDSLEWCDAFIAALRDPRSSSPRACVLGDWLHWARQYAKREPRSLTNRALQIWTGAKTTQIERGLVGRETLGTAMVHDGASAQDGLFLLPPVLDLQIDTVVIRWMKDVQEGLMKDLLKRIVAKKPQLWLDIALSILVLASAAECVAREQEEFVREHETHEDRAFYVHVRDWSAKMIEHLHFSVQHLLCAFRTATRHAFGVDQLGGLLGTGARLAQLDEQDRQGLMAILASLANSSSPITMEYVTASGATTELSWIAPLFEVGEVRG